MKLFSKPLQKFLYHTKLSTKYLLLLIVLLCAELFVVNFYIRTNAADYLTEEAHTTSKQFLEAYVDNINYKFSKYNSLLSTFASNEILRTCFSHPTLTDSDCAAIDHEIRQILRNQYPYGFYNIAFYTTSEYNPEFSKFLKTENEMSESFKSLLKKEYYRKYFLHSEGQFNIERLSILYPIYSKGDNRVVCTIHLSLFPSKVFRAIPNLDREYPQNLFLINSEGALVYGSSFPDTDDYLDYIKQYTEEWHNGYSIDDYYGNSGVYITSLSSSNGFRAVYYSSFEDNFANLKSLNRTLTCSILILMLITLTSSLAISTHIDRRFSAILNKIDTVRSGNLIVDDPMPGTDEISIFDRNFTDMVKKIRRLIETNYIIEMKKKDAQLMALQAQIRPHFLFNSLEIINSLIELGEYDDACEANSRLSQLLRYSINHNSCGITTVWEELNYTKDYLYIQSLRLCNKFQFHEQVDETCLNFPILKLILQPLIENSIKHGFQGRSYGNIWLCIVRRENNFVIKISDDGNGMSEKEYRCLIEKLDSDFQHDFQEQNDSIGILNIHHRLKLKYGSGYKMEICTASGQGMHTILTLPLPEEYNDHQNSEENYENTDC